MIEDATVKCDGCGARDVVRPFKERLGTSGLDWASEDVQGFIIHVSVPDGWRPSYGASGRGSYVTCPSCVTKKVRIDDSSGIKFIDIGGFVDD